MFRRYGIRYLVGLSTMLSRGFHGSPYLLKADCVVLLLYSPKLKPFHSFSIQTIWSSSHPSQQSNGWHSSFLFGRPSFRYQPGYRLLCLIIQGFSLHPSGKMKGQCLQIPRAFLCTFFAADYSTDFPTTQSCNLSYWLSCAERKKNTTLVPPCQFVLFSLWV